MRGSPEVECSALLRAATLEVTKGGTMKGNIQHSSGSLSSSGVVVDMHKYGRVKSGGYMLGGPQ